MFQSKPQSVWTEPMSEKEIGFNFECSKEKYLNLVNWNLSKYKMYGKIREMR